MIIYTISENERKSNIDADRASNQTLSINNICILRKVASVFILRFCMIYKFKNGTLYVYFNEYADFNCSYKSNIEYLISKINQMKSK